MSTFRAFRVHRDAEKKITSGFEDITLDDLTAGEVVIRVEWSSINYKDALAATGAGAILRSYPLVSGIDLAGTVESSASPRFSPGQRVVVCGGGLSETLDGGYTQLARVPEGIVVPLPDNLSTRDAMAIGTAGFTAALAMLRLEDNGQVPERGPIVVTGATGGVGSLAVGMLAARGYEVLALTGKPQQAGYLKSLGATGIIDRNELDMGTRPLERAVYGGAIDNLGGDTLAWLTRVIRPWGNIVSIGLAQGHELHTTVMPFILRGVGLLGVTSSDCLPELRLRAWERLADDLRPGSLDDPQVIAEVGFDALPDQFQAYLDGRITGRNVVRIAD